jgi:4-diphosphocytidyl-2-C-methyl-D-erythritol kinase
MLIRRQPSADSADSGSTLSAGTVHVLAPAKINLYLEILGKRPDGYHDIATLMLAVELFDELDLDLDGSGSLSLSCDVPGLSTGPDNLVLRAAGLLQSRTGCSKGAKIHLTKRIPWAAGLGGGSSDAAATLAGLNELWQLNLSAAELAEMGAEIGSDVPFFFHTPAAWCTGRGEKVAPVNVGRAFDLVLVKPPIGLSTAEVYRNCGWSESAARNTEADILEALVAGDVERIAKGLHNRLQDAAFRLAPSVAELYRRLRNTGAAGCLLSGSGSCLFALCRDRQEAQRVIDALSETQSYVPDSSGTEPARNGVFLIRSCTYQVATDQKENTCGHHRSSH